MWRSKNKLSGADTTNMKASNKDLGSQNRLLWLNATVICVKVVIKIIIVKMP